MGESDATHKARSLLGAWEDDRQLIIMITEGGGLSVELRGADQGSNLEEILNEEEGSHSWEETPPDRPLQALIQGEPTEGLEELLTELVLRLISGEEVKADLKKKGLDV